MDGTETTVSPVDVEQISVNGEPIDDPAELFDSETDTNAPVVDGKITLKMTLSKEIVVPELMIGVTDPETVAYATVTLTYHNKEKKTFVSVYIICIVNRCLKKYTIYSCLLSI